MPPHSRPTVSIDSFSSSCEENAKVLAWEKLSVSVSGSTGKSILCNVSGSASSGQVTGILGHSGSGKTTLLKILGGRDNFRKSKRFSLEGSAYIDGQLIEPEAHLMTQKHGSVYVGQDDSFLQAVTPREAIRFSARLRLPRDITEEQINGLVKSILSDLKLTAVQDRVILRDQGLSGGEKRRVSLGLELVTRPKILFLDEITSGLDSHNAHVVMELCREIAQKKNAVVLMVIHQPDSRIFSLIDHVVLMKEGLCMYNGSSSNVEQYMRDRGFPKPNEFNMSGWLLEVSQENSRQKLKEKGFFSAPESEETDHSEVWPQKQMSKDDGMEQNQRQRVTLTTEIKELFVREFLLAKRDPFPRLQELGMVPFLTLLVGIVFEGIGKDSLANSESFGSHVGVVFIVTFGCSIVTMISVTASINSRQRFCREYVAGYYRLISYGVVMTLFELVFILVCGIEYTLTLFWTIRFNGEFVDFFCVLLTYGAVSSVLGSFFTSLFDVADHAQTQIPLLVGPQLLLSGFVASKQSLAFWIRWMVWLQPVTYSFRLMLNKEFRDCQEMSNEERLRLNCLKAFQAGSKLGFSNNYDDESILTVAQAGEFVAVLRFWSFWRYSPAVGTSTQCYGITVIEKDFVTINEVNEGFCDSSLSLTTQSAVNKDLSLLEEDRLFNFVTGRRIRIRYPEDLASFTIEKENVFIPPAVVDAVYGALDPQALSSSVCQVFAASCPEEFLHNGFNNLTECIDKMELLPIYRSNAAGLNTVDSNSTGCRHLHATMAVVSPQVHCPHLSFTPMVDINDKIKCSVSSDNAMTELFTKEDFVLFQRGAQMSGIDTETLTRENAPMGICTESVISKSTIQGARGLPEHMFCYSYLESQQATDDDGLISMYWIALFAFMCFYGLGGLVLLRSRARNNMG